MSNVPKLRFPGFEEAWEGSFVSEVSDVNPGNDALPEQFQYIDLESVVSGNLTKTNIIKRQSAPSRAQRLLEPDDILFQAVRPYQQNNYLFKGNTKPVVASTGYIQMRVSENPLFMYQLIHTNRFLQQVLVRCTGTSYPAINSNDFVTIRINWPGKNEQTKIADFLTLIDKKITKQDEKVAALEQYKKGLLQKIFSREIRFKDDNGKDFPEWLWEQLLKVGEKIRDKNDDFRITNVISNSAIKGLIKQRDYFEKDIANIQNINNYYIIKHGDFVYNPRKSNEAPYGPIKIYKSYELGIVSPLYLCFRLKKEIGINEVFISYFFDSKKWHKYIYHYADRGARYDRVSMQDTKFFEMKMPLPSNEEQTKIANFLSLYDRKIEKEKAKLEALREQKKGLLQQMFV